MPPRFAALERLSTVKETAENQALALERQHLGNENLARLLGGEVGEHFCDPDKSAYKEGVVRPEFDRCLKSLPNWDGLLAADLDRVTRDPAIGEVIIARVRQCPNPVVYTRNPEAACGYETFDLSTERGRESFRTNIIAIRREARKASERQASRHQQWRDAGRPVGSRAFGEKPGKLELDQREADLIRQAAADLLAGKAIWTICAEWQEAGVLSPRGTPFARTSLRNLFLSPRLAGWRVHKPEPQRGQPAIPRSEWIALDSLTGKPVKSLTPAILDEETWQKVCAELEGRREPQAVRPNNRATYLLGGLCCCGKCTLPMFGHHKKSKDYHIYKCGQGCVTVHGPKLDEHIIGLLTDHWALAPEVTPEAQPFPGEQELGQLEARLEELEGAYAEGLLTLQGFLSAQGKVKGLLEPLKADRRSWLKSQAVEKPLGSVELWRQADPAGKRLMVRQELELVKVSAAQPGLKHFDPRRVEPVWR
jgi:site-specific DNA recombinase